MGLPQERRPVQVRIGGLSHSGRRGVVPRTVDL